LPNSLPAIPKCALTSNYPIARWTWSTKASMPRCASPAYLTRHGVPQQPEDLVAHACLTYEYSPQKNLWPFQDGSGGDRSVRVDGPLHANNGRFLVSLAVAGVAITIEPDFIVAPEVRAGRLVPLLQAFESAPANIYLAYPSRRHLSAKVRAFADFLAARFVHPEWLLASALAPTAARGLKPRVRTRVAR